MDGRKFNGARKGEYRGQGRKPKASELELIEKLSPMEAEALHKLAEGVRSGDFQFLKLFFEYRFGKPKQQVEDTGSGGITEIRIVRE
jgi:hypothetical protein